MKREDNPRALLKLEAKHVATLDTYKLAHEIDKRVRRVFAMCASDSKIVREAANEAIDEYVNQQRALFQSKGLEPDRALKEAMVASEENGKTIYRIVKRKESLEEIDMDDEGVHVRSVSGARSYSSRVGLGHEEQRGKYNDGAMLISQAACSVDLSEVVPFVRM